MQKFALENYYIDLFKQQNSYKSTEQITLVGIDEAGRGPLAGPVVAASVILDQNYFIEGIKDSKLLSKKQREKLYAKITKHYRYSISIIEPEIIDNINILEATKLACVNCVKNLNIEPNLVLVDGNMKFSDNRFISIVKGDRLSYIIAASSIVAKVSRDAIMTELSLKFPQYGFASNAGYGTKQHLEAIKKYGISIHHRKTFNVAETL